MDRAGKEQQVSELRELLNGKQSVVLTDYRGMSVQQMFDLRRACDKEGVGYRVFKNSLAKLAVAGTDFEILTEGLEGPVGWVYSEDAIAPARVLATFIKECEHLDIKLGYLNGKKLEASDINALSKLPSKDALKAQLLNVFNAPATKLVGVFAAGPRDFVGVLAARKNALDT
jgi:large subunit ribosomal protein L10